MKSSKTLKRILAALLSAVVLFGSVPFLKDYFAVTSNAAGTKFESAYTKEQIAAYRKKLYNYMKSMATLEWTASEEISYNSGFGTATIKKGWKMLGIPYKAIGSDYNNLKRMQNVLAENGSVKKLVKDSGHNDCSTAVGLSYYNVITDFKTTICSPSRFYPWSYSDFVRVGTYTVGKSLSDTRKISGNKKLIKEAYGLMKKGDILTNGDHAMMVVSVNAENHSVKVIDQMNPAYKNLYSVSTNESGKKVYKTTTDTKVARRSSWGIDRKITFDQLWTDSFIPVKYYRFKNEDTAPTINISAQGNAKGAVITVDMTTLKNVQKVFLMVSTEKKPINKDLSYKKYRDAATDAGCLIKIKDYKDTTKSLGGLTYTYSKGEQNCTYYYKIVFKMVKGNTATYISSDLGSFFTSTIADDFSNMISSIIGGPASAVGSAARKSA